MHQVRALCSLPGLPNEYGPRPTFARTESHEATFKENQTKYGALYPYDNVRQLALALALAYPRVHSNPDIQYIAVDGKGVFLMDNCGFRSVEHFHNCRLDIAGCQEAWDHREYNIKGAVDKPPGFADKYDYWALNVMAVLCEILGDPRFADDMVWAPCKCYDAVNGHRVYGEMHTADWWWECQLHLHPQGRTPATGSCTVISIILSSDKAVFGSLSGQQKGWPLLMTVGNIHSRKRFLMSESNTRMIGLLPIIQCNSPTSTTRFLTCA